MGRLCDSNANAIPTPTATHGYSHSYRITQPYTDRHSYGYSDHYSYSYSNYKFNCYSLPQRPRRHRALQLLLRQQLLLADGHGQANAYCAAPPNTEATTYAAAAPLRCIAGVAILGSGRAASWFRRPRRNELSWRFVAGLSRGKKVRAGEDAIANTRNACAPRNIAFETSG